MINELNTNDLNAQLNNACLLKNLPEVKRLVAKMDVNIHANDALALMTAASSGFINGIKYLFNRGGNPYVNNGGILTNACVHNQCALVEYLIKIDIDKKYPYDSTIYTACVLGLTDIVSKLLTVKSYDKATLNGYLLVATTSGNVELVKLILSKLDGNVIPFINRVFFNEACSNGHLELILFMIEHHHALRLLDEQSVTAAIINGHTDVVLYLLRVSTDKLISNKSVIRTAVEFNRTDIVSALITTGRYVDIITDITVSTVLYSSNVNVDMLSLLISNIPGPRDPLDITNILETTIKFCKNGDDAIVNSICSSDLVNFTKADIVKLSELPYYVDL